MKTTAGTYKAILEGAFLGESKEKKTPYFGLEFKLENGETMESVHYLTETTKERNLKVLLDVGFIAAHISDIADESKPMSELFRPVEDINVIVEMESYQDGEGNDKEKPIIKWVNVGYRSNVAKFDKAQAVKTFKGLSIDGDLARIRKEGPKIAAPKPAAAPPLPANFAQEDIPF